MQNLPLEIHKKIFQYLGRKDLQTCYFVSKSWSLVAIPMNWKVVTIRKHGITLVKSYLNNIDHSQYFKYGHITTMLSIEDTTIFVLNRSAADGQFIFSKPELLVVLNQFPNLKEIDLHLTEHTYEYTGFLLDADMPNIKKIKIRYYSPRLVDESYRYDLLFLVYYKFRNSITCVDLLYNKSTVTFRSQQIDVLNSLSQFKQLTELVFHNKYDVNLTPFQLQKMCPNLKRLEFASDYPISESTTLLLLNSNSRANLNFVASLTDLTLELPSLSTTNTRYLVDYFPNHLTKISIEIKNRILFSWINIVGMELASSFMEKVGRIKYTYVGFRQRGQYEAHDSEETEMTKYFKVLNAFRGTRQTDCIAEFDESNLTAHKYCSFKYDHNGELHIVYGLSDTDFHGPHAELDLPNMSSSIIGPAIFSSVIISLMRVHREVLYSALNYSFVNCPKLQKFLCICDDFQYYDKDTVIHYYHQKDLISSDRNDYNINFLEMNYISPAQYYFDLVTTHLHDIEVISLKTVNWGRLHNDSVMNLTGFKKLKNFNYSTSDDYSEYGNNDFILLKFTNGKEQYYYLDEEKNVNPQLEYHKNPTAPRLTIFCDASVSFDFQRNP